MKKKMGDTKTKNIVQIANFFGNFSSQLYLS